MIGRISRKFAAAVCFALASPGAFAALAQGDIGSPGGFITAYGGIGGGFTPGAGADQSGVYSTLVTNEMTFINNQGTATVSYTDAIANNSGSGSASFGVLDFSASNDGANSHFSQGAVNGGWKDSITINSPGLAGQAGVWFAPVVANGFLEVDGFAGSASFIVNAYVDGEILRNEFLLAQTPTWAVSSFGAPNSLTVTNQTAVFAIPIVFGDTFELGIYGLARAGMRSSSGVPGNSTAAISQVLIWGGAGVVEVNDAPVASFTIDALSGADWTQQGAAVVPLPSAVILFGSVIGLMFGRARRQ